MTKKVKIVKLLKISEGELVLMKLLNGGGLQKHQILSHIPNITSEKIKKLLEGLISKLIIEYVIKSSLYLLTTEGEKELTKRSIKE